MNYYAARQLRDADGEPTGKWHYTCLNRRMGTYPVGYCAEHEGHDSAEEACECFRRYLLDEITPVEYGDWTGCAVCDYPTKRGLQTRVPLGDDFPLCADHWTEERVRELAPEVVSITSSY